MYLYVFMCSYVSICLWLGYTQSKAQHLTIYLLIFNVSNIGFTHPDNGIILKDLLTQGLKTACTSVIATTQASSVRADTRVFMLQRE